jgi:transposase
MLKLSVLFFFPLVISRKRLEKFHDNLHSRHNGEEILTFANRNTISVNTIACLSPILER